MSRDCDPWLQRWLPLLAARGGGAPVLELGCGAGRDTAALAAAGLAVFGLDTSAPALRRARARLPGVRFLRRDLRAPLPVAPGGTGAIVASLCLHYFPWRETAAVAARLRRALRPGGVLLCRLNSIRDFHHGARGHPRIGRRYFRVDGERKRFFDRADVRRLFARGWRVLSLEERVIRRYEKPKVVWEVVLERAPVLTSARRRRRS
ncbi:MAG: class I SAM-dependent methyltransferase [Betaproteobacteria bacterium]|nr:class I SAM-dependent methyltransferase [Betaproteobacteria bacterium]MDH5221619.1 class I SAM-dependent methyltransferase [Betaproteobacteria bacterium]MDH5352007.1 class I SAM-dependent methyltransferase [Betaproteobacteria bacterium]